MSSNNSIGRTVEWVKEHFANGHAKLIPTGYHPIPNTEPVKEHTQYYARRERHLQFRKRTTAEKRICFNCFTETSTYYPVHIQDVVKELDQGLLGYVTLDEVFCETCADIFSIDGEKENAVYKCTRSQLTCVFDKITPDIGQLCMYCCAEPNHLYETICATYVNEQLGKFSMLSIDLCEDCLKYLAKSIVVPEH